ncbi:MAG: hypothetical protein IPG53_08020 [Ignavibacteriales bacterium]|nr:hypothetical protein [Ignavibacteriales bacterium]
MVFFAKEGLWLEDAARELLLKHFNLIYRNRDKNFGNARIVRNIFDSANRNRILRLAEVQLKITRQCLALKIFLS